MPEAFGQEGKGPAAPAGKLALAPICGLVLAAGLLPAGSAAAQYTLRGPSDRALTFDTATVREMLERTRRTRRQMEGARRVVYYVGSGPPVTPDSLDPAYPWGAVTPKGDTAVRVVTPGNYREASRAYQNYAYEKMQAIRSGSEPRGCAAELEREAELVSAFVDGWVVSRVLYGAMALEAIDRLAFAREAGHLPALLSSMDGSPVAERCRSRWQDDHPEAVEAFRDWSRAFGDEAPAGADDPASGSRERSLRVVG